MQDTQLEKAMKITGMALCVIIPLSFMYIDHIENYIRERKATSWLLDGMHKHLFEDSNEWRETTN